MKVVIDTSSLLSLVRYYIPFDNKGVLFNFIKGKIEEGEIIIIDKVFQECKFNAKGIVLSKLNYLVDKQFQKSSKLPYKTDTLLAPAPQKFLRQVDNQFVNQVVRKQKNITNIEFENQKNSALNGADFKQIILCLNIQREPEEIYLVTEETATSNDNKLFKKIPAICRMLNIGTMTLPEMLTHYDGIDINFQ